MTGRGYRFRHRVVFQETNLVGNVYFAHYVSWQGSCREHFLMEHAPGVVTALQRGELALVTVNVHVDYLDEVFAGDSIDIDMFQAGQVGSRIEMLFEYRRDDALVARGTQTVTCMRRAADGVEPVPVPTELRDALRRFAAG